MRHPDPDFNRFLAAVTRDALPDRVPNIEAGVDWEMMERYLGRPIADVRDHAEFWRAAGYDYVFLYVRGQPIPDHFHQEIIGQPYPDEHTGTASAGSFGARGVHDDESFEEYPWCGPEDLYYDDIDRTAEVLPDGMKIVVNQGPLFSGIWRMMGLENFAYACVEDPDLVRRVSEKIGETCVTIAEQCLRRDCVGAYWIGDDMAYTTGLMASPAFLRERVFPYYRRIGKLCLEHRKPLLLHSDGKLTEVLDDLIDCGIQAIHPNEPTSVDIFGLKRQYGDRLAFAGNIDVDLLTRGTPEQIAAATRDLIERAGPGGGLAVGSGNSITKDMPLANYQAMLDAVGDFGGIHG